MEKEEQKAPLRPGSQGMSFITEKSEDGSASDGDGNCTSSTGTTDGATDSITSGRFTADAIRAAYPDPAG